MGIEVYIAFFVGILVSIIFTGLYLTLVGTSDNRLPTYRPPAPPPEKDGLEKHFTIEHYPLTGRYYPKYKDKYLHKEHNTGIVQTKEEYLFMFANYFSTEDECYEFMSLFKEHQLKNGVKTIPVQKLD